MSGPRLSGSIPGPHIRIAPARRSKGMTLFHLIPRDGGWALLREDQPEPVQNYIRETREEAIDLASEYVNAQAEYGSLQIHGEDGRVEAEITDPPSPTDPEAFTA